MTSDDRDRLKDVLHAASAIEDHMRRGDLDDRLVLDAVRLRLIEIGEAIEQIDRPILDLEPEAPWPVVVDLRDHLTHRGFDASHDVVAAIVDDDLALLVEAVERLLTVMPTEV